MLNKVFTGIVATTLVACMLPISAFAETATTYPVSRFERSTPSISAHKNYEIETFAQISVLENEWKEFVKENPGSTEAEQEAHLRSFISKGGLENTERSIGDYLPGYGSLNPAERALALAHPIQAIKVYADSKTATNRTIAVYGNNGWQDNSDAFRHCLWNALMKKSIGATAAEAWATAHEYDSNGLDKAMDLWNNRIGRSINVSGKSVDQIVGLVKTRVRNGDCRRIVGDILVKTNGDGMK